MRTIARASAAVEAASDSVDALRADGASPSAPAQAVLPAFTPLTLERLLGTQCLLGRSLTLTEQQGLARLRELLALPRLPDSVLPRTPAVVPQLLGLLRAPDSSMTDLARCVARDSFLVTEVMRLANSPIYRPLQAENLSLQSAIAILGTRGLQAAASRVVLRPLLPAGHAPLLRVAAEQVAHDGLTQAEACVTAYTGPVPARFDAYLGGLLHGSGRLGVLVALDRAGLWPEFPCSEEFSLLAIDCADRLFGRLLQHWALSPTLSDLGSDLAAGLAQAARQRRPQDQWPVAAREPALLQAIVQAEATLWVPQSS